MEDTPEDRFFAFAGHEAIKASIIAIVRFVARW
jgi:hypothetical protein